MCGAFLTVSHWKIRSIYNTLYLRGDTEATIRYDFEESYQKSYDNTIGHFVQSLEQNTPFETGGFDNLQTLKLVEDACRLAGLPS